MLYRGILAEEVGWAAFSAPEAGGARGRALLAAQGAGTASLPPAPRTGSRRHCLLWPLPGEEEGLRPQASHPPPRPTFQAGPFTCAGQLVSGLGISQQSDPLM